MSDMRFHRPLRILFSHCDPAGIVFFPQYLVMLNNLVEQWITDGLGISYAQLLGERRIGLPTVHLVCDFKAISRMGDEVVLSLWPVHIGRSSLRLHAACHGGAQERLRIEQTLVFTDLNTHRPVPMPPDIRRALPALTSP